MSVSEIPRLVRRLYKVVAELDALFGEEKRSFTPDGHLVGSIGEILAKHRYGLRLLRGSAETHDGIAPDGTMVQIKATQGSRVALSSKPEHLVVLKINKKGRAEQIYNGPGELVWEKCGGMQKNGQRPISVQKLRALMVEVPEEMQLPVRNDA